MIVDTISNFEKYINLNENFSDVQEFLLASDLISLEAGKIDISPSVFAIVSNYQTKNIDDSFIEYHKKHIDIQMVIKGNEKIGYAPFNSCKDIVFYEDKDYGELEGALDFISLNQSNFAILFTYEGHMPQIIDNEDDKLVKKIVFKIKQG
jgi:biofilm protein TabA